MIFVTGGTGLLGSHLLYHLVSSGRKVRALKRHSSDTARVRKIFSYYSEEADALSENIRWVEGDLLDYSSLSDALDGVSEIYHCGALVSFHPGDHKRIMKVNVDGTANLVNLAINHQIKKFCFASSIATLGRASNEGLTDEETFWVTSRRNSIYSISKYGAEREVWRGMEEGLNAVIVNPSVILGPGFWDDNSGMFRLVWQGLRYYTKGVNGYVDVKDVARIMILLMDNNKFNERFILSSENISYRDLLNMIARHLGKPAPSVNVSPVMGHAAWRLEQIRSLVTGKKPDVTREMAATAMQRFTYSNEKIRKTLEVDFIPVEESVRQTCLLFLRDRSKGE